MDSWKEKREMLDSDIAGYIWAEQPEQYENVLRNDSRWEVFYHLSQMRTSLLNWYDFGEGSSILEIGGGFGAITGLLCRRCRRVVTIEPSKIRAQTIERRCKDYGNLKVIAKEWSGELISEEGFDYVFLNCEAFAGGKSFSEEDWVCLLQNAKRMLNPHGKLLMAADNRYGIKYFCGESEPETGRPFAGIYFPEEAASYLFGRKQMQKMITRAGFSDYKFYYPLPGNQFPQLIYSDEYLPQKDVCERLVFYYRCKEGLVGMERKLYSDLLDNGVFPFFANSFFVECGKKEDFCSVVYAALSTDRGRKDSFATKIKADGIVEKTALYPEGKEKEQIIYENLKELEIRGIRTVPHRLEEKGLAMPYVDSPTCSDYLRELVKAGDSAGFVEVLDRLYKEIIRSSEHEASENNAFPFQGADAGEFGIILKTAYIDMVPFNCFYINQEFVFFDQEFSREHYPVLYTMFRALKYTYLSIPEAEEMIPLKKMKERYHLEENWELFSREEDRFVSENRRYDVYGTFYSWTWTDEQQMRENAKKLLP